MRREHRTALSRILTEARRLRSDGETHMKITRVLDLADPAGEWQRPARAAAPLTLDPTADPLTGCMPVTPATAPEETP